MWDIYRVNLMGRISSIVSACADLRGYFRGSPAYAEHMLQALKLIRGGEFDFRR